MFEPVVVEAVKSAVGPTVGSTVGYFLGRWFGKKEERKKMEEHRRKCAWLRRMEFSVAPSLVKDVVSMEVSEGCIEPDQADEVIATVLRVREKYGLNKGWNFVVAYNAPKEEQQEVPVPVDLESRVRLAADEATRSLEEVLSTEKDKKD